MSTAFRMYIPHGFWVILVLISWNFESFSQTEFKPGYVVVQPGDTIFGEIEQKGDINMATGCNFRTQEKKEIKEYLPAEINSYRVSNGRYYVSKEIWVSSSDSSGFTMKTRLFLEFLVQGKMNLYYLRDRKGDHFFIQKGLDSLVELKYEEKIREVEGRNFYVKSKKHIGLLYNHTQDAPQLRTEIENIETPNSTNMIRLVTKYHKLTCNDQKCTVFKKSSEPVRVSVEALVGGAIYHAFYIKNEIYPNASLMFHLSFPSTDRNYFLKSGMIYTRWVNFDKSEFFFKIPIHFEYVSKGKILKGRFSVGPNIYTNHFLTVSGLGGFLVKIFPKVHLSYNIELESPLGFRTSLLEWNYGMQCGVLIGL